MHYLLFDVLEFFHICTHGFISFSLTCPALKASSWLFRCSWWLGHRYMALSLWEPFGLPGWLFGGLFCLMLRSLCIMGTYISRRNIYQNMGAKIIVFFANIYGYHRLILL